MRPVVVPLLVLLPKILGLGCAQNSNDTVITSPSLIGPGLAIVGSTVTVSHTANTSWSLGYDGYGNGACDNRRAVTASYSLESATCAGARCQVEVNGNAAHVTATEPGTVRVHVAVTGSDGSHHTLTRAIRFAEPTALDVTRDPYLYPAGASVASLVGASQEWRVVPRVGAERAFASNLGARGDGAVHTKLGVGDATLGFRLTVTSVRPGVGGVALSLRDQERTFSLVVVDPNEVVSASLLAADPVPAQSLGQSEPRSLDVARPTDVFRAFPEPLTIPFCTRTVDGSAGRWVALRVADGAGSVAFGDIRLLRDSTGHLSFSNNWIDAYEASGEGVLSATVGRASLSVPFVVESRCDDGDSDAGVEPSDAASDAPRDAAIADGATNG